MDYTITPKDIFEEFYIDILTTFPDIENDITNGLGVYDYLGQDAETMFDFLVNAETLAPVFDTIMANVTDILASNASGLVDSEIANFEFVADNFALTSTAVSFLDTSTYINNKITLASIESVSMVRASTAYVAARDFRGVF